MLQKVPYLDGFVYVDPQENIGWHIYHSGVYEPKLIQIVTSCMESGFDFVDIGANIGLHTLAAGFAAKNRDQALNAFEPEAEIYRQLVKNCSENNLDVLCHQIGLSDQVGELTLYVSTDHNAGAHSFIHRESTSPAGTVPVKTLDLVFEKSDRSRPTLIKIDVEGFEMQVLKGGMGWLSELQNAVLLIEVTPNPTSSKKDNQVSDDFARSELITQIEAAGFAHRMIIHDFDTFDEYGNLYNDYFNIACWKGGEADKLINRLIPDVAIQRIPYNATGFIGWDQFSTVRLRPAQSHEQIDRERRLAAIAADIKAVERKLIFKEFGFSESLIGKIRKLWYGFAAKWGVRYLADQQYEINHKLFNIIKSQQEEIEYLRHQLEQGDE